MEYTESIVMEVGFRVERNEIVVLWTDGFDGQCVYDSWVSAFHRHVLCRNGS